MSHDNNEPYIPKATRFHSTLPDPARDELPRKRKEPPSASGNANFYALASYAISHLFPMSLFLVVGGLLIAGWLLGDSTVDFVPVDEQTAMDPAAYENLGFIFTSILILCGIGYVLFTLGAFVMGCIGVFSQPIHRKLGFGVIVLTLPIICGLLWALYLYSLTL